MPTAPSATSPRSRRIAGLDAGEEGLDAEHEGAASELDDIEERLAKTREEAADRERGALAARKEALELGLNRKDGAGALLAASEPVSGLLGSVAALLSVRAGYETAIAGALGSAADAVAVEDVDAALGAISTLKSDDLGRRDPARRRPGGRRRVAGPERRRGLRHRRRRGARGAPLRAGPAAVQGRGGRRPRRRPRPGHRPARRHRGDPRRRRPRRPSPRAAPPRSPA